MHRTLLLALAGLCLSAAAFADPVSYVVTVNTAALAGTHGGYLDIEFNQANAATSLDGVATITGFSQTGFTFGSFLDTTGGVTGSLGGPTLDIPNDQSAANYYTQGIDTWGSGFSFIVTFTGPIVGGTAPDLSSFFVFLMDSGFNFLDGGLVSMAVAEVDFNGDGTRTAMGGVSDVASATVVPTPEPASLLLLISAAGGLALFRRRAA